jgi:hypothetical protein
VGLRVTSNASEKSQLELGFAGTYREERERERTGLLGLSTAVAVDFIDSEGGGMHLGAAKPPKSATEELPRSGGGRRCPPRWVPPASGIPKRYALLGLVDRYSGLRLLGWIAGLWRLG